MRAGQLIGAGPGDPVHGADACAPGAAADRIPAGRRRDAGTGAGTP
ncbi:MAG: hypothetical protein JWR66_1577, partial [Modestobacter sp.]|nr:hypothetical protein [Modestobacter sp.]